MVRRYGTARYDVVWFGVLRCGEVRIYFSGPVKIYMQIADRDCNLALGATSHHS